MVNNKKTFLSVVERERGDNPLPSPSRSSIAGEGANQSTQTTTPKSVISMIAKERGIVSAETIREHNQPINEARDKYVQTYGKTALEDYQKMKQLENEVKTAQDFSNASTTHGTHLDKETGAFNYVHLFDTTDQYLKDNFLRYAEEDIIASDLVNKNIGYMTDEERKVYNYLFSNKRYDEAEKYIRALNTTLRERKYVAEDEQRLKDIAEKGDSFGSTLLSIPQGLTSGIRYGISHLGTMASNAIMGTDYKVSPYSDVGLAMQENQALQQAAVRDASPLGEFLINTGVSIGQNILLSPLLGVPGGAAIIATILASSAAGNTMYQKMQEGASAEEAAIYGTVTGIVEAFLERTSFGALGEAIKGIAKQGLKGTGKEVVKTIGRVAASQALQEGLEEGTSELAGIVFDTAYSLITRGELGEISDYYNSLIADGKTEGEAVLETFGKFGADVLLAAAGGALSGGVMGGGGTIVGATANKATSAMQGLGDKISNLTDKAKDKVNALTDKFSQVGGKTQTTTDNTLIPNVTETTENSVITPDNQGEIAEESVDGERNSVYEVEPLIDGVNNKLNLDMKEALNKGNFALTMIHGFNNLTNRLSETFNTIESSFHDILIRSEKKRSDRSVRATNKRIDTLVKTIDTEIESIDEQIKGLQEQAKEDGGVENGEAINKLTNERAILELIKKSATEIKAKLTTELTPEQKALREEQLEKYGAQDETVYPYRQTPKATDEGKVGKTAATLTRSSAISNDTRNIVKKMVTEGEMSYNPKTRAEGVAEGKRIREELGDIALLKKLTEAVDKGVTVTVGEEYALQAILADPSNITAEQLSKLVSDYALMLTIVGRIAEANKRLLERGISNGKAAGSMILMHLNRVAEKLNHDVADGKIKLRKNFNEITIPNTLSQELLEAKTAEDRKAAAEAIMNHMADQIQPGIFDKLDAIRYTAMLGNVRTAAKNFGSNFGSFVLWEVSNWIQERVEKTIKGKSKTADYVNTAATLDKKSANDQGLLEWANNDFADMGKDLVAGGRYDMGKGDVMRRVQAFDHESLNKVKDAAEWLASLPDTAFLKRNYTLAMARFFKANGITAEILNNENLPPEVKAKLEAKIEQAREQAVKSARRQAQRETSKTVQTIQNWSNSRDGKLWWLKKLGIDATVPFARTTVNTVKNMLRYSPLSFADFAMEMIQNKGRYSAHSVEALSNALTGTAVMALGVLLGGLGFIRATDDDENEAKYNQMLGRQNYSLVLGDTSISLDWAVPMASSLMFGVELWEALAGSDSNNVEPADVVDSLLRMGDVVTDMTMLDSINSYLEALYGNRQEMDFGNFVGTTATELGLGYVSQFIPQVVNQTAQFFDTKRRDTWTVDGEDAKALQRWINKQQAKIPLLRNLLPEHVDQYGRTDTRDTAEEWFFDTLEFLGFPGYISTSKEDEVSTAVKEIYNKTGKASVIPDYFDKEIKDKDGVEITPTKAQQTALSKTFGTSVYNLTEKAVKSDIFNSLDYFEQADILTDLYNYSKDKAIIENIPAAKVTNSSKKMYNIEKAGVNLANFLACKKEINADYTKVYDRNGKVLNPMTKERKIGIISKYLKNLTTEQKRLVYAYFDII